MASATNEIVEANGGDGVIAPMIKPQDGDLASLTHAIVEWRRLTDEVKEYRQSIRERNKKLKALEEVILRVMKSNNIGALDLKNSGGRVLFKRSKRQAGMGAKNLQKYLSDYFKSESKATEAIKFINEHRETFVKESLMLEKDEE
jgi:hypothetical protein